MAQGMNLLRYPCERGLVEEYERQGHRVVIRKNRNGWLRWRLDDRKTEINTLAALTRINIDLAPKGR